MRLGGRWLENHLNDASFAYKRHINALDGMRALAFASVLAVHLGARHFPNGGLGVNIFFTLSGFLITTILLSEQERTGRIHFRRFYARRALRLMPALVVLVIFFTVYVQLLRHSPEMRYRTETAALPVIFYFGNWLRALVSSDRLGLFDHTWSLSIEEQFYLIWPCLLAVGYKARGRGGVIIVAIVGSVISVTLRLLLWHGVDSLPRIYNGTDTAADQLLVGCTLAVLLASYPGHVQRVSRFAVWPAIALIAAVMATQVNAHLLYTVGYSAISVASAIVIGHLVTRPDGVLGRTLSWRPLELTGRISYGLYLWHFPLILTLGGKIHNSVLRSLAVVVATFVAATVSYRFVEQPAFRLRDRLFNAEGDRNLERGTARHDETHASA